MLTIRLRPPLVVPPIRRPVDHGRRPTNPHGPSLQVYVRPGEAQQLGATHRRTGIHLVGGTRGPGNPRQTGPRAMRVSRLREKPHGATRTEGE